MGNTAQRIVPTNTPEAFANAFAELRAAAIFTNASEFAEDLYWNKEAVCVEGGFDALRMALRALSRENKTVYSVLSQRAEELFSAIADWHDHVDDENEGVILSWGSRHV